MEGLAETEEQARQFKARMVAGIPLGRLGISDDVAKAVVFLASTTAPSSMEPNFSCMAASRRFERSRLPTPDTQGASTRTLPSILDTKQHQLGSSGAGFQQCLQHQSGAAVLGVGAVEEAEFFLNG
jgi:hypothetical protein